MATLLTVQLYIMGVFLSTLAGVVLYRLVTRQINMKGLLKDKLDGGFSPGRLQMLMATLLIAMYFLDQVLTTQKFPELPREFLMALGGSHLLYLGGKTYGVVLRKLETAATRMAGRISK